MSQDTSDDPKVAEVVKALEDLGAKVFFEKALTSSDVGGTGRVVIPKAIAEQYFPRLDNPSGLPVRAVDTMGRDYSFKFRFWTNNQSRMYLLEGAGELHRAYDMSVGDVMVFAQKPDGGLVIAGRPATRGDVVKKAPIKRPAADKGEKGPRTPRDVKPPRRSTGDAGVGGAEGRKRRKPSGPAIMDIEAAIDGIFRAVPNGLGNQPGGVFASKQGRWVVTLNLMGELYQAYFDTKEDAYEAYYATGASPATPATV